MSGKENDDTPNSWVTRESRHWIEYGVFAFVLIGAVATATAAWYTRKEWESSVDNGHRQLRAYVFPDQANLVWQGTARPAAVEIVIRNSGQTPAYRLTTAMAIIVAGYPLQGDPPVPPMPNHHTVVPPNGSYALSMAMEQPLTSDQLKAIQKGTQAVYAFGEISYVDAFDECRITRYRFYHQGAGPDVGAKIGLTYLDEGNTEVRCPDAE
jgi:hypothetical protein